MSALKEAVQNGKQVTVFIEVKARFDEEANLRWVRNWNKRCHGALQFPWIEGPCQAGHGEADRERWPDHVHLSQYRKFSSEGTARVYSIWDCLLPMNGSPGSRPGIFLPGTVKLPEQGFEHLLVGQFNLVDTLTELIHEEVRLARLGLPAEICPEAEFLAGSFSHP